MSVPETPTTFRVTAYCQAEKARTEELFARVVALSAASSWPSARAAFGRLARRISLHIRLAEDAFFPLFELKTGGETGLTLELVDDHRAVLRDLEQLRACLHERRLDDLPSCVRALRDRLNLHDGRELRLLCPLIDRMLSDDERAFLGSRIMAETKSCSAPPTRLGEDESGRNRGRSLERKPKR
jgi:hypothetical protein